MLPPHSRNQTLKLTARAAGAVVAISALAILSCATPHTAHVDRDALGASLQQRGLGNVRPDAAGAGAITQLPPGVSLADGLDETKAVAIALWNNAAFQENLAKLGLARGDLAQAGMLSNPTLSVLLPIGPKQLEFTALLPLESLWLRPKRIAIAEQEAERVAKGLVQSGLDLARDVRVALSDYGLAADRESVAQQTLTLREQNLAIAQNRQRLGDASEIETINARAEVERMREEAVRFGREKEIVRGRLALLLGWPLGEVLIVVASPPASPVPRDVAELEAKALAARPDLRASEIALEAAGKKAGLAESEVFSLSGILDANGSGKEGFEIGPGVALPLPILNRNDANRLRAKAELERAGWNYLGTRQRIVAEVREARLKLEQASAALAAYESQVIPPLEELHRLTRRAYELSEISPVTVQENSRQLLLLEMRRAELRADIRRAWAELERGVGAPRQTFLSPNPKFP
jgi:outer membrane protein, heavy metal efflux system